LQRGDSCQARGAGAALNRVVAIGTLVAAVRFAAVVAGSVATTIVLHAGVHISEAIGLHHVAETRRHRLGRDHKHQNDYQQFHAISLVNYCD
jgi:uncharacterized membrane protein YqgA involved in biofilm formation